MHDGSSLAETDEAWGDTVSPVPRWQAHLQRHHGVPKPKLCTEVEGASDDAVAGLSSDGEEVCAVSDEDDDRAEAEVAEAVLEWERRRRDRMTKPAVGAALRRYLQTQDELGKLPIAGAARRVSMADASTDIGVNDTTSQPANGHGPIRLCFQDSPSAPVTSYDFGTGALIFPGQQGLSRTAHAMHECIHAMPIQLPSAPWLNGLYQIPVVADEAAANTSIFQSALPGTQLWFISVR